MSRDCFGLGGAPDIDTFVERQLQSLSKCSQNFESVFDHVFRLEENVMAEYTDGNRIYRVTYGECKRSITRVSAVLSQRLEDVPHGGIIGLHMDNCIEWIELFWGIMRSGFVPLLMNKRLGHDRLEQVIAENSICAVISDDETFAVPTLDGMEICREKPLAPVKAHWADEVIFMTSGTSGRVRLCGYSGERICRQIYNTKRIIRESREIKAHVDGSIKQLCFLPFYHVFGFLACYMWFAFFARTFVFLRNYNSDTILKTIRKHKVTHIFAVPMLWTKIESAAMKAITRRGESTLARFNKGMAISHRLQRAGLGNAFARKAFREVRDNIFGDSVRFMISGGGSISERTLRFFNGIGYRLVNGYGMTEIGIASVQLSRRYERICSSSIGKPFESVEYKSIDGELAVRAGSMASYIIENGVRTPIDNRDWYMTEDSVVIKDNAWYVCGRRDDIIVTESGENIEPSSIEEKLVTAGAECVLLGIRDETDEVKATLIASLEKGAVPLKVYEQIKNLLSENELQGVVSAVKLTFDPLLKENEFKLNRKRLREDIESGRIAFIDTESKAFESTFADDTKKKIISIFEDALGRAIEPSEYSSNFFYELGGSSLSYFEVIENVKNEFDTDLLSAEGQTFYSINDVYGYVISRCIKV